MKAVGQNRGHGGRGRRLLLTAEPWLYASPAIILIASILLVPLAIGLSYAFRDIQLLNPFGGDFVGLDHFRTLWNDENFWNALRNTLLWTVCCNSSSVLFWP